MATNFKNSSNKGGTATTKKRSTMKKDNTKSNAIKNALTNAYSTAQSALPTVEQESWSNPYYQSINDVTVSNLPNGNNLQFSKATANTYPNGGGRNVNTYGVDTWNDNVTESVPYDKSLATPVGTFNAHRDADGVSSLGYTSPLQTSSRNIVYDNPMTTGGHYDDFSDAYVQAGKNGLYAGVETPFNMSGLGEHYLNTPVGRFGVEGGYDSPYGLDVSYEPQPNSILATLLANRYR